MLRYTAICTFTNTFNKYMYNYIIYVYGIICDYMWHICCVFILYIYIYYDVITPIYVYSIHKYFYYTTTYIRICFATQASKHLSRRRVKPCTTSSWTSWTTTSKKSLISSGGNHMIQVGPCEECWHFQDFSSKGGRNPIKDGMVIALFFWGLLYPLMW